MNEVLIVTLDSPSWVGWREIRVFGTPTTALLEETASSRSDLTAAEQSKPVGENVAHLGIGVRFGGEELAGLAIDGDPDTIWTAQHPAPQWYSVSFDELYVVDKLVLEVAQPSAGPSTHEIWLGNGSSTRTFVQKVRQSTHGRRSDA